MSETEQDADEGNTVEKRVSLAEVKRLSGKVDQIEEGQSEIIGMLKQLQAREVDGEIPDRKTIPETVAERAMRESDRGSMLRTTQTSIKAERELEHLSAVLAAALAERQDVQDAIDYGVLDFITTVEDLIKWASKVGKNARSQLTMEVIKWILVAAGAIIIGVTILQPADLTILQESLGTERNQFIAIALFVGGGLIYLASFILSRRGRKPKAVPGP